MAQLFCSDAGLRRWFAATERMTTAFTVFFEAGRLGRGSHALSFALGHFAFDHELISIKSILSSADGVRDLHFQMVDALAHGF